MAYTALSGLRVVDLTHYIAGPYATKLLSGLGAEVIKVEPPGGEEGRRAGAHGGADRGPLFSFLNLDKLGITLDLKRPGSRALMRKLLATADLLIENFAPGTLARLDLEPSALQREFPRLSIVSISNFGQDGPDREHHLSDLTLFARGGWTYPVGDPAREPLTPPGSLVQYVAGLYGAIGAMQATLMRGWRIGRGQYVDISLLEAAAATMIYEPVTFQYSGVLRRRAGDRFAVGPFLITTLKCRDGYVTLQNVNDAQFTALCEMMNQPQLATDPRFATALQRMMNNDALLEIAREFFAGHDARWLYHEGQRRGIVLALVPNAAEVLESEQLHARNFFEVIDDPALGRVRVPGPPFRLAPASVRPSRPAPRLGEHNRRVLGGLAGVGVAELQAAGAL